MNLDAMKRYSLTEVVDVVVVGTGAGGAPLLARLTQSGLHVVALEAGRNFTPRDFRADEVSTEIYWMDERLASGTAPQAFGANNSGSGVGGSMLHWGAFAPRATVADLRLHSLTGQGCDWPLDLAELAPYYRDVEAVIGVSGPASYPWEPERGYEWPPVALNAPAQLMQLGCQAVGLRTSCAPVAALSRDVAPRQACIGCGYCHQGCRNGAKASMDVTFLPQAVTAGAEIRPESFVHGIERDINGLVCAVIYRNHGVDQRQRCRALVLCAGAVETPRLLLHTGLANSSGQVGRNYMAHVATQVWGTFADETRPNKGFPASLITEDMLSLDGEAFAGRYITQSLGIVPVTWATQVARGRNLWGRALVDYLDRYNHVAGIGINGDCLPQDENFLELSGEIDHTGVPKPLIRFSYGPNEQAMTRHAARALTRIWEAAGASDIWTFERAAHTIGTCRLGDDPAHAVVDAFGRSYDIANLWISDNSVFPSALAANPALTIMALSLRTAERLIAG